MAIKMRLVTLLCVALFPVRVLLIWAANDRFTKQGDTAHQCPVCNQCFSSTSSRNRHIKSHTEKKSYECDTCKRCFRYKFNLEEHQKVVHGTERLHQCDKCSKTFKTKRGLREHQSVHSTDRAYACDICSRSFKKKFNLTKHQKKHTRDHHEYMKTHIGEKPFQCDECGRAFAYERCLKRHKQIHTRTYQCDTCEKLLVSYGSLERHKEKVHKEKALEGSNSSHEREASDSHKKGLIEEGVYLSRGGCSEFFLQDDNEKFLPLELLAAPPNLLDQATDTSSTDPFTNALLLVHQIPDGR